VISIIILAFKAAVTCFVATTITLLVVQFAQAEEVGWYKVCSKVDDIDVCSVQNAIIDDTGQLVVAIALIAAKGNINRKSMQVTVPTGRFIPPGVVFQIDSGKEQQLPYAICMTDKCIAEVPFTDRTIRSMKNDGDLVVMSVSHVRQPNPIKMSLKGFSAAFNGSPVEPSELEKMRQEFQEANH